MPIENLEPHHVIEERMLSKSFESEADALEYAEQRLRPETFQTLRTFVQQGYFADNASPHLSNQQELILTTIYIQWCQTFQHPYILLDILGTIHLYQSRTSLRPHQIEALEALGWSWAGLGDELVILPAGTYSGTAEDAIQEALDIVGPAFKLFPPKATAHTPTTPVESRYERLMSQNGLLE